jgi:hypothetical protein
VGFLRLHVLTRGLRCHRILSGERDFN